MFLDLYFSNALGFRGEISDERDIERNILLYTRDVEVSNNLRSFGHSCSYYLIYKYNINIII